MSEEVKSRTLDDIKREYTELCAKAGQAQYQAQVLLDDVSMYQSKLKDLNLEASALAVKEKKEGEEKNE